MLSARMNNAETSECQCHVPAIGRERAVDVLCTSDELVLEPEDAEYAIRRLLERGYFYAVGDELRVTLPSKTQ